MAMAEFDLKDFMDVIASIEKGTTSGNVKLKGLSRIRERSIQFEDPIFQLNKTLRKVPRYFEEVQHITVALLKTLKDIDIFINSQSQEAFQPGLPDGSRNEACESFLTELGSLNKDLLTACKKLIAHGQDSFNLLPFLNQDTFRKETLEDIIGLFSDRVAEYLKTIDPNPALLSSTEPCIQIILSEISYFEESAIQITDYGLSTELSPEEDILISSASRTMKEMAHQHFIDFPDAIRHLNLLQTLQKKDCDGSCTKTIEDLTLELNDYKNRMESVSVFVKKNLPLPAPTSPTACIKCLTLIATAPCGAYYEKDILSSLGKIYILIWGNKPTQTTLGNTGACELTSDILTAYLNYSTSVCLASVQIMTALSRCGNKLDSSNDENIKSLGEKSNLINVINLLVKKGLDDANVAKAVSLFIRNVAISDNNIRSTLREANACVALVTALNVHMKSLDVTTLTCWAIWMVAVNNAENKAQLAAAGACEALVHALNTHNEDVDLSLYACGSIGNLAAVNANRELLAHAGACEILCSTLSTHLNDSGVVEKASAAIANISMNNAGNKTLLGAADVCPLLMKALETHMNDPLIVQQICGAISFVAVENAENKSKFVSLHIKEILKEVKNKHQWNQAVMKQRNGALTIME